jgi:hypothetical protein
MESISGCFDAHIMPARTDLQSFFSGSGRRIEKIGSVPATSICRRRKQLRFATACNGPQDDVQKKSLTDQAFARNNGQSLRFFSNGPPAFMIACSSLFMSGERYFLI